MPTPTQQLTKVQEQVLELVESLQKPVIDSTKRLAERAQGYVPEVPRSEKLPALDDFVLSQINFAEKLLSNQRDFTVALLDALKPVTTKLASETKTKPKSAAAKAA